MSLQHAAESFYLFELRAPEISELNERGILGEYGVTFAQQKTVAIFLFGIFRIEIFHAVKIQYRQNIADRRTAAEMADFSGRNHFNDIPPHFCSHQFQFFHINIRPHTAS